MKQIHKHLGILLGFAVLVTLMTTTVLATNVSNTVYTSNLVENDELVLTGDTTLFVNADLTLKSISGDYTLEIQGDGVHTLTVNSPNGCAINVKALQSVKPSQGTVNLTVKGGSSKYAIYAEDDISLSGINLNVSGGAGIRSYEGNITINGTHVSVVGENGVAIIANGGSINIDSDYLFVQCAGQSGDADWEHGIGAVKDITIISDDATITGKWGVFSQTGNVSLAGKVDVGATNCAIEAKKGTIAMTGAVTAQGGDNYFAMAATGDISFDGTKLDVKGDSGIRSANGNVTINGTNVSVVGQDGVGVIANSGSINIDSDYLFVQCAGQSGDAYWEHGIGATNDVTIISDDATITGRWGVFSQTGNVTLSGNVGVGATNCAIEAKKGTIAMTGAVTAQGGDNYFAMAATGDISFDGTKLDVKGDSGIRSANGDVTIEGTNVSVVGQDGVGVIANKGSIYIDSDYLFVQCAGQSGDAYWEHGVGAKEDVTIISDDATIAGRWGVFSQTGNVSLAGKVDVGATKTAIDADEGTITMTGSVTVQGGDNYFAMAATGDISFDGTKLDVKGDSGIRSVNGDITINGTQVSVVGQDGVGVIANKGSIYIDSDYLFVQCAGQSGDSYWEHGIGATNDVTIISDDATIAGRWGVYSETGSVTLWGNFWVGARKTAIHAGKNVLVYGDLSANNTDQDYFCIVSADGDITLSNGTINVASTSNAVITHNGNIYLNGNITAKSSGAGSCAINAREGDIVIQGGSLDVTAGGNYAMYAYNGQIGMNQPLAILIPANGHIATNTIVDVNENPASHVEIGQAIGSVSVSINSPVAGDIPASTVYNLPEHCKLQSVEWFVSDIPHGNNEPFTAGLNYKVKIVLKAEDGYRFVSGEMAKVNGKDATTGWNDGGKGLIITYTFSDCPAAVKQIALSLATPVEGESIYASKYKVTDNDNAFNANTYTLQWQVSADGGNTYTNVADGTKFVGGNYYRFYIDVQTNSGYEFALDKNNDPAVSATVNGNPATVSKAWEQEPSKVITVCYHVGMCNERLIKTVEIVNLEAPYPGKTPDYTATTFGTAYSLENSTATDYMTDKMYKSNGIVWYDENDNYLLYDQPFEAGKSYRVKIYLDITDTENFEFDQADGVTNVTGTINGNPATVTAENSNSFWNHYIEYIFDWQPITVTEINITGLDAPVAGETPDFTVTLDEGHDQLYTVAVTWYEYFGNGNYGAQVTEEETFAANTVYRAEIVLEPKKNAQYVNLCRFAVSEQTVHINGKSPVEPWLGSTYVSVSYDFQTSADKTEHNATLTGFIQADFGTVDPFVALYDISDAERTNPLYTAETGSAVKNGDCFEWAFTISDVPAGTYNLVITKDGHLDSIQQITVSSENRNMGIIDLQVLATSNWTGDSCTVTLETFEEGVTVMVASYENGKLVKVEYLTVQDPTAILTGDNVKVFFLDDESYAPIRSILEMIKP